MGGEVLVALLVTVVLGDEVKVLAADDEGTMHLGGDDGTGQDTATDGDLAGEGALLVCSSRQFISAIRSSFSSCFGPSSYRPLPCRQPLACTCWCLVSRMPSVFRFRYFVVSHVSYSSVRISQQKPAGRSKEESS